MGPLGQEGKIITKGEEGRGEFMGNRPEIADLKLHFLGVTAWCKHTVLLRAAQQLLKACTEGETCPWRPGNPQIPSLKYVQQTGFTARG